MGASKPYAEPPPGKCPICTAPRDAHYRPFCSKRCADVDLWRWLRGAYAIAGGNSDADEDGDDAAARLGHDAPRTEGSDEDA
jgi:endogenous inhibitor of DNA gyrase (YacG/DUF329 family)